MTEKSPVQVCLVVSDFYPRVGGISTLNTQLARALAAHPQVGHVLVIALQGNERHTEESAKLTVRRIPLGGFFGTGLVLWQELRAARRYDIFHSPNVFPVGFLTLLICKYVLHKPFIATFMGTDVLAREGSFATRAAKRFVLRHATTTTISESTRALAAKQYGLDERRIPIIYPSLPAHPSGPARDIRRDYGYKLDEFVILTVSALVKRKGTEDVVRALARLPDPRIKLLIVGDGPERLALEALVQELGVQTRVRFAGRVREVDPFYHGADVFVLASYFMQEEGDVEGFGIVFIEAQQHGLPVVGTKSGGIPETMIEGESGILVKERNVSALAAALQSLAGDPPRRHAMGERGASFVARRFSAARAADEYVALYESLIPHRHD